MTQTKLVKLNKKTNGKILYTEQSPVKRMITDPYERTEIIQSKLNLLESNEAQIPSIGQLCLDYSNAFYIGGDQLKTTDVYEHSIKLRPDKDVIFVRQYRIPEIQKEEIQTQIDKLLENNIIEKSTSRFNSPILLVKKRKRRFLPCG